MAKDVNIHVKVQGAEQTKSELEGVAKKAENVGHGVSTLGDYFKKAFEKFVIPLDPIQIFDRIVNGIRKIITAIDDFKKAVNEAVRNIESMRSVFNDLFEAMDAFDERSRRQVTAEAMGLLAQTGVSPQIGLPVMNAYARQFRGMVQTGGLTQAQYDEGLRGMLGYAERRAGPSAVDLIALMSGWGMVTPQQQGLFRRQISGAGQAAGLTDKDIIDALARGMPTIQAMGWTPEQAISTIASLSAGEAGRKKLALPATTMQGLISPNLAALEKLGISAAEAQDPQQVLARLSAIRENMSQQAFTQTLIGVYGGEAAGGVGVAKLLAGTRPEIGAAIFAAGGPAGAAAEQAEEQKWAGTIESVKNQADALRLMLEMDMTDKEVYMAAVRKIGAAEKQRMRRRRPVRQWFWEAVTPGEETENERMAYQLWLKSLSPEERAEIESQFHLPDYSRPPGAPMTAPDALQEYWRGRTPEQKYQALQKAGQTVIINDYSHNNYPHTAGNESGERIPSGVH
jgi:outer membrane lipoprotein SlyB